MRAEAVADDGDPHLRRVEGAQVAAELHEPGPGLARLDVPAELVFAQLAGGGPVPHPGGASAGRPFPGPGLRPGFLLWPLPAAHCRPGRAG